MENNNNDEERKKPKYLWTDEDWDNVSIFHKIHRKVSGVTLVDEVAKFYLWMIILAIVLVIFTN